MENESPAMLLMSGHHRAGLAHRSRTADRAPLGLGLRPAAKLPHPLALRVQLIDLIVLPLTTMSGAGMNGAVQEVKQEETKVRTWGD